MTHCNVKNQKPKAHIDDTTQAGINRMSLKDTEFVKGNVVVFLRPDSARFENYLNEGHGIYEIDSDFGFGISAAMDTMELNSKFKNIQAIVSVKRYILLIDCNECPKVIDRDTIDYGTIFIKVGKNVLLERSNVFASEALLNSIMNYFGLN